MAERVIETDVLVIGGGGAGCFAAVHAKRMGLKTTIVCKGIVGKSGNTLLVGGGLQCDGPGAIELGEAGNPKNTKENLFKEILIEGFFLNNQKLVELWCRDAALRVKEYIDWGYRYRFTPPGRFRQAKGGDMAFAGARAAKKYSVDTIEDVMVTDLLTANGKCVGAIGIDINTGEFTLFKAKAVVLATSGWACLWNRNTNANGTTGDGQAMAYRAGAELVNMEMLTYNPCQIIWPPRYAKNVFPYNAAMQVGGKMLDNRGEDIMKFHDPKIVEIAERTKFNKLIWSVANARVVSARNASPHGGVYFSWRHIPPNILDERVRAFIPDGKFLGEDISEVIDSLKKGDAIEIGTMAHYAEGGILINENCETNLPGLYAAGEAAAGVFGANRACDATTEMIVLGAIAGESAAAYAKNTRTVEINQKQVEALEEKILAPLQREEGIKAVEFRKRMQKIANDYMWIIKNGPDLKRAIEEIEKMKTELPKLYAPLKTKIYNLDWIEALEVENMLLCLEAAARSALMRKESRGVHYRTDYPKTNPNWLKEIVVKQVKGRMQLSKRPLITTTIKPPKQSMTLEEYMAWAVPKLNELGG